MDDKAKWSHLFKHQEKEEKPQPKAAPEPINLVKKFPDLYEGTVDYMVVVDVPDFLYLTVEGKGDPRSGKDFRQAAEAIYAISFGIQLLPKHKVKVEGYYDFDVPPLEAHFSMEGEFFHVNQPKEWQWWVGVIQPGFVNERIAAQVAAAHELQKHNPKLQAARLVWVKGCKAAQMLHVGSLDEIETTYEKLRGLMKAKNLRPAGGFSEIYIGDPRVQMQTIIRQPIAGSELPAASEDSKVDGK